MKYVANHLVNYLAKSLMNSLVETIAEYLANYFLKPFVHSKQNKESACGDCELYIDIRCEASCEFSISSEANYEICCEFEVYCE